MNTDKHPILSIIIISHEQREELRRCMESILAMELPFPYEIIVSDDRSTDGTDEMMADYIANHRQSSPTIAYYKCNSDEGNCANNSQRSGYNRCNAYPHARGKYIAHVDADDYFRPGAKVYEKQVAALEAHPDCALAMSNCLSIDDCLLMNDDWRSNDLSQGKPWAFPRKMVDGEVIDQREFVRGDWFRLNQCFIQRRNPDVDPVALYGNRYVDSVITYHHLQFGTVVYVEACDYVWVKSGSSITGQWAKQNKDTVVMWCLGLYIPVLIPMWAKDFCMGSFYQQIREVIKLAMSGYWLQEKNQKFLESLHVWIYDCFGRN